MKQILHDVKSNSHGCIRLATCIATAFAVVILTICSDGNGMKSSHSNDEAIREYHDFLTTLRQNGKASIQTLIKIVNEWRALGDSMVPCISRDIIRKVHSYPFMVYHELNGSTHTEPCRMAMSRQHIFYDLLYLREQASPHVGDEELQRVVREVQPFFASPNSLPIYSRGGKRVVLKRYLLFPQKSAKQGIHDKEDLLAFIKGEYLYFKFLLQYLPDFVDDDIGDIRRNTEHCCREILRAADCKDLSHKDAMMYLPTRTNHRLLRNAQTAIEDLNSGRIRDEHTIHAYLLMVIQPLMAMDDLSASMLSDKDKADLYKIADTSPKEMDGLAKELHSDK